MRNLLNHFDWKTLITNVLKKAKFQRKNGNLNI